MNRIVRENYPVADLPEDLREGLAPESQVRIVIEEQSHEWSKPERPPSLDELFALRRPPYKTMEEIVAEVRRDRDSWDD